MTVPKVRGYQTNLVWGVQTGPGPEGEGSHFGNHRPLDNIDPETAVSYKLFYAKVLCHIQNVKCHST